MNGHGKQSKYWICDTCAALRRWNAYKTAYTVIEDYCGWCHADYKQMLTPLRDLKNAEGKRADCTPEGADNG